jgi:hypothetical protein
MTEETLFAFERISLFRFRHPSTIIMKIAQASIDHKTQKASAAPTRRLIHHDLYPVQNHSCCLVGQV